MYFRSTLIILFLLFSQTLVFSQETGNLDKTISFNDEDRNLSLFVPEDYDPEKKYDLMVCLHGLGDNSANFRNALISYYGWNQLIGNTIFVCPDGGSDQNKDFYEPEGDEGIIIATIDYIKSIYNIDEDRIILEGFSLGGRSALKFGLDNPEMFRGLLLNTPAVQGMEDANNNPLAGLVYNYSNASEIPIAIVHGEKDATYINPINRMYEKLVENDGIVFRKLVPGMQHSISSQTYTMLCMDFIDTPLQIEYDIELVTIDMEDRTCNSTSEVTCRFRNAGSATISSFEIAYNVDGNVNDYRWTGELLPFQHTDIVIQELSLTEGINAVDVSVAYIHESIEDMNSFNNSSSTEIIMSEKGRELPIHQSFEGEADGWLTNESGNWLTWSGDNEVASDGDVSVFMLNTILMFYNTGTREEIVSPVMDLTTLFEPALSFDVAFNYQKYTQPYFQEDTYFSDTLEVLISTDCGDNFESIYRKAGADLATTDEPIENPLSVQACIFIPGPGEWRNEIIDLSDYVDAEKAVVKLSYISGQGGSINIDNISFEDILIGVEEEATASDLSLYPNPARSSSLFSYHINEGSMIEISLYNSAGSKVQTLFEGFAVPGNRQLNINTTQLVPGMYFVHINSKNGLQVEKLIVE